MRPLALLPLFLAAAAGQAEDMPSSREKWPSIFDYAAAHPTCAQWTDECFVCRRLSESQDYACSTAGTACIQGEPRCLVDTGPHDLNGR